MPAGLNPAILAEPGYTAGGNELLGRLAKARGVELLIDRRHGKGSHSTLRFGGRKTTLKDLKKEIGPGLLKAVLNDIGLTPRDLDE
jgi:mRNA interferase HicA